MEDKECKCIVGCTAPDEHGRSCFAYDVNYFNPKYFIPFKYCPLCGKLNEENA